MIVVTLAAALVGCGSGRPPLPMAAAPTLEPSGGRSLPDEYRLQVGDELVIHVIDQADLGGRVKIAPDGRVSAAGIGAVEAAGRTVPQLREALRAELGRILRYPEVTITLSNFAEQMVYVFGEVQSPGAQIYTPDMTTLHALAAAQGVTRRATLRSVLVLRRSGPSSMDVYRVDLDMAVDGEAHARDLYLQPFDVVYIPRSFIGEVNVFVDRFIRQNIAPFSAYIEGWKAFHMNEVQTYEVR